jgi:hypothetical protein
MARHPLPSPYGHGPTKKRGGLFRHPMAAAVTGAIATLIAAVIGLFGANQANLVDRN